jgi:hypothetical protein
MAPTAAVQASQALGVDRHELSRNSDIEVAEATRRLGKQVCEPVRTVAAQDAVHGAGRHAENRSDSVGTPAAIHPQR